MISVLDKPAYKNCFLVVLLITALYGCSGQPKMMDAPYMATAGQPSIIAKNSWLHGEKDCDSVDQKTKQAVDVYAQQGHSFIVRQNKCVTYEAPFIYVLVGTEKILVIDSGALAVDFSLYAQLQNILGEAQLDSKQMLVIHSHAHRDHYHGDHDFIGREDVQVVHYSAAAMHDFFGFKNWPNEMASLDLGGRELTVIPTPGHQEEAISIYDPTTQWLITGDTLYPGEIYVKDWSAYRASIERLVNFTNTHPVSGILGGHIEMSAEPAVLYPIGSTYQPNETQLDLNVANLAQLHTQLVKNPKPSELVFDRFIIQPMNWLQRTLSNIARWVTQ